VGDVLSEDLISALSRVAGLKVISRASAFRFRERPKNIGAIRDSLHVAAILEGTVRRIGERLHVTAELVDVSDDSQLWSETYQGSREDLATIEREIVNDVGVEGGLQTQLGRALTHLAHLSRARSKTRSLYTQARFFWNKRTEQDLEKAIDLFQSILAEDPRYAPAYAGLAEAYGVLQNWGERRPSDIWPSAELAARKAVALDDSLAEAHVSLGHIKAVLQHDWLGAGTEFRRAMDLDPGSATAHFWYATLFLAPLGRLNEALRGLQEAMNLDPLAPNILVMTGEILRYRGYYEEARQYQEQALQIEPRSVAAYEALARTDILDRKFGRALVELEHAQEIAPKRSLPLAYMVYAHVGSGNLLMARTLISRLHSRAQHEYVSSFPLGTTHLALGDRGEAIRLLDRGAREGAYYVSLLGVEPLYRELYGDARFRLLLKKVGLLSN
jgi:serine/threonine-protein kinase